jgi:hypothetical protein
MIILSTIAVLAALVATWAQHKAKTWTPTDHTLARRLVTAHSVRI